MGAESSSLKGCVLEQPAVKLPSGLTMYSAVLQDGKPASVFVYRQGNDDKVHKAAKHLKTLRHPCLLRFLSCSVQDGDLHLVTERVQPLKQLLANLTPEEICAGIYDLLQALVFLHDRGRSSHNNVSMSTVFVSEDGHWKLGGMETVCKFSEATPQFLVGVGSVRESSAVPPEEKLDGFRTLPERQAHSRDAFSFGMLVQALIPRLDGYVSEEMLDSLRETLQVRLLTSDPAARPTLSSLLTHEFFRNDFLDIMNFLKSLTLKSEEEKNEFFKFLLDRVHSLPEELIGSRLAPKLLQSLVFAEPTAVKSFLPHMLRPKRGAGEGAGEENLLSLPLYRRHVIPQLLKLFKVNEEHVRMVLLSHMHMYAEFFSHEELKNQVLPQVLLGMRDTSDTLVAMTLQSLATLVPLLGAQVVVGGERIKVFKRTTPNFSKFSDITPETSPVHSLGAPPHISQPSKGPALFPKPSENCELVLEKLTNMKSIEGEPPVSLISGSRTGTSRPVNDFSLKTTGEKVPRTPQRPDEDWPDWDDAEDRPAQISLQASQRAPDSPSAATEEPWEEFKDSTSILLKSSDEAAPPVSTSKALKLSSAVVPQKDTSQRTDWEHRRSSKTSSEAKGVRRSTGAGGLGEEFSIEVKKKLERDPELDFFADMEPDIKLSSPSLQFSSSASVPLSHSELGSTLQTVNHLELTAKFAAADLTEAEAEGWGDSDINWEEDETSWGGMTL